MTTTHPANDPTMEVCGESKEPPTNLTPICKYKGQELLDPSAPDIHQQSWYACGQKESDAAQGRPYYTSYEKKIEGREIR